MGEINKTPINVVHFIGSGRSGSTLLNILLDNHPSITGVGELSFVTRHIWPEKGYCGCGRRIDQCEIWNRVFQNWIENTDDKALKAYIKLQAKFERYRRLPFVLWNGILKSSELLQYSKYTTELYRAIQDVSEVSYVADASKHPVRVRAISLNPDIDLRVIHIMRDPRGVAWSRSKLLKKVQQSGFGWDVLPNPVWKTAFEWVGVNLLSNYVAGNLENVIRIRYEDLIIDPNKTLLRIGRLLGLDFQDVANRFSSGKSIRIGHIAAGNKLRMQDEIQLNPDESWKKDMPVQKRALVWRICSWLMRRYGYRERLF